jgi:hypothetical protein
MNLRRLVVLVALAALAAGCMPAPSGNEITVANQGMRDGVAASQGRARSAIDRLELGRSINDDRTINDETNSFEATDTVYASLRVRGDANAGILRAVWIDPQGNVAHEQTRIVTPSRDEVVALEAARPQGWRGGQYQLDVFLDGRLVESRSFRVAGGDQGLGPQRGLTAPAPH